MTPPKTAEYAAMAPPKLDSILNMFRTTVRGVDIRRESEWDLSTLEHAKTRLQWLAADALPAMNLIDQLVEQPAEDQESTLRNP